MNKAGQDNEYQHVIFMSIPWHDGGYRTMCARAVEPTNEQKAMILALKGITAAACLSIPAGSKVGLMQLVIETNKCFDEMVGDKFPRTTLTCKRPMHVSLGEMEVKDGGVLSLEEKDVGTRMIFYDINKAEKEGHFGPEPVIWKAPEMHFALEMISNALDLEGDEWEKHVYSPTMWQDEDGKRRKSASPQQRTGLEALRNLKRNPSLAAAHMRNQPGFSAKDVGLDRADLESPRKKAREVVPKSKPVEEVVQSTAKEIMLTKHARPAPTADEKEAHQAGMKAAKLARKKDSKRAKKEQEKAKQEMADRVDEIVFQMNKPMLE